MYVLVGNTMSAHFKWYPATEEVVVPWNARYSFPAQANKAVKITARIPPKNGAVFLPGNVIRTEWPAQGFVNPINTTFEFDVTLYSYGDATNVPYDVVRFQNNIQSIFNRIRIMYGATPLEDIINYNTVVRALTEWTATNQCGTMDQTAISEGIGGYSPGAGVATNAAVTTGFVNTRQSFIQGIDRTVSTTTGNPNGVGIVPNTTVGSGLPAVATNQVACTRRYQVNLALGLLTQDKLLPTKFMASQLAIEFTLEQPSQCIIAFTTGAPNAGPLTGALPGTAPTYGVTNFNMITEILEFDSSYDAMFIKGLEDGGVPLKFSSWHTFIFSTASSANVNLQIQERSRSVKALFTVQRRNPSSFGSDSHALLFDTAVYGAGGTTMQNYQYRVGGRFFPAQPVQLSTNIGTSVCNGGAEAFVELQKALNVVGDYRLSTSVNPLRWAVPPASTALAPTVATGGLSTSYSELDFVPVSTGYTANGNPTWAPKTVIGNTAGVPFVGNMGSNCYTSAIDLETSNGIEISGLNAEEQSDIAFLANWSAAQASGFSLEVYTYYDAMIILRPNNVLELVQ